MLILRAMKFIYLFVVGLVLIQCQTLPMRKIAENRVVELVQANGKLVARDTDLEYIGWGLGSLLDVESSISKGDGMIWAINLVDHKQLTLDEARVEILSVFDNYKQLTVDNPNFMKTYQVYTETNGDPLFNETKIGIKLAFWDENVDRPRPPYVAQIRVAKGEIKYFFVADETQRLGDDPVIETIAEARLKTVGM